jgi:hypothetical protein
VFDDELAIIGSANCNNRGYAYDSEVIGAITDLDWRGEGDNKKGKRHWYELELTFAHRLRMALWHEHLALPLDAVHDPVASALYWRHAREEGCVEPFKENGAWWYSSSTVAPAYNPLNDPNLVDPSALLSPTGPAPTSADLVEALVEAGMLSAAPDNLASLGLNRDELIALGDKLSAGDPDLNGQG